MAGIAAILGEAGPTNEWLADAWRDLGLSAVVIAPQEAELLDTDDVLLGRLEVLPTLDGIRPGLGALARARRRGLRVLNDDRALVRAHDKLLTATLLARAGVPHPRVERVAPGARRPALAPPVVVKPRYGSWGRDVFRCRDAAELDAALAEVAGRGWFRRHGALVQELVPPPRSDLRLLVAGGRVVGAAERIPAPGEWRTNTSLGGSLGPTRPTSEASELALAAVRAVGCDLAGVDLLPAAHGFVVLEVSATIDFDRRYSLPRSDVYAEAADALGLAPVAV